MVFLGMCFSWGCLMPRGLDTNKDSMPVLVKPTPDLGEPVVSAAPAEMPLRDPQPEPPPMPVSSYHAHLVYPAFRTAASLDPTPEKVKMALSPADFSSTGKESQTIQLTARSGKETPVVNALREAIETNPSQAHEVLIGQDLPEKKKLPALLKLTKTVGEADLDKLSTEEVTHLLDQLTALRDSLRRRALLSLEKVCFCKTIEGFGHYYPKQEPTFNAGKEGRPGEQVQVYAEVRNFQSRKQEGNHETILATTLDILDEKQEAVVTMDLGHCQDLSQTPRQDYFLNFQFRVPARLKPGAYTLRLTVKDVTQKVSKERTAQTTLDFKVAES
jgi:hypothetical protein